MCALRCAAASGQVEARVRGQWLLGLLALQSLSSFILEANEGLIREHLVITLFLTMLVGAGGNSGARQPRGGVRARACAMQC
jgi:Mg/Co/Ni transporter MgtE